MTTSISILAQLFFLAVHAAAGTAPGGPSGTAAAAAPVVVPAAARLRVAMLHSVANDRHLKDAEAVFTDLLPILAADKRFEVPPQGEVDEANRRIRGNRTSCSERDAVEVGKLLRASWVAILRLETRDTISRTAVTSTQTTSSTGEQKTDTATSFAGATSTWKAALEVVEVEEGDTVKTRALEAVAESSASKEAAEADARDKFVAAFRAALDASFRIRAAVADAEGNGGHANAGKNLGLASGQTYRVLRGGKKVGFVRVDSVEEMRARLSLLNGVAALSAGDTLVQSSPPSWVELQAGFAGVVVSDATKSKFAPGLGVRLSRYHPMTSWSFGAALDRYSTGSLTLLTYGPEAGFAVRLLPRTLTLHARVGIAYGKATQDATRPDGSKLAVSSGGLHLLDSVGVSYAMADFFTVTLEGGYPMVLSGYSDWGIGSTGGAYGSPVVANATPDWAKLSLRTPQLRLLLGARF